MRGLLHAWYFKLVRECESNDDAALLDTNTRHMCTIHAHLLLMLRNATAAELTDARVTTEVAGLLALRLVRDRCGTAAGNDGPWARVWTRGTNAGADASERRARAVTVWR